jgi:hypothetical protein
MYNNPFQAIRYLDILDIIRVFIPPEDVFFPLGKLENYATSKEFISSKLCTDFPNVETQSQFP